MTDPGRVRMSPRYKRAALVHTLTYHQRMDIRQCMCGWDKLGASHAEHVADMYEQAAVKP